MKKIIALSSIVVASALLASCAGQFANGAIYTGTTTGLNGTGANGSKTGQACTTSILGMVATGDASIAAAKADGRINSITSVDYSANNILGIYGQYCTIVKGN